MQNWIPSVLSAAALLLIPPVASAAVTPPIDAALWQPLILDVDGSATTDESNTEQNPFLDIRLDVTLTRPSGTSIKVPGFYAGNGAGLGEGSVWRVRFHADEEGLWQYAISHKAGPQIAVADDPANGQPLPDDGSTGTFTVGPAPENARGFEAKGRLDYVQAHYLRFANGEWFIKGGVDSPENFFGFAGFDNTYDQPGGASTDTLPEGIHRYSAHVDDWQQGDPDFFGADSGESGRAIIGAINYLAEEGVNSLYFLPMNLGGDGRDTWPFISPDGSADSNVRYDISKLHQWNIVLEHMQKKGILAHVVLAETEVGNSEWFDGGALGVERRLFYRELVARFGYLLALKWNLSEESRFSHRQMREFADYIQSLDWARHPIAFHTRLDQPQMYDPVLGDSRFTISSIQASPENFGRYVEQLRDSSAESGQPWVIDMDEVGPYSVGLSDSNTDELRRSVLYPTYFSGGNLEWYFGYHELPLGGDMRTENFRTRETMFRQMRYAREFMQTHLPFAEMQPADGRYRGETAAEVFMKVGEVFAVYLPEGNAGGVLDTGDGLWRMHWFNPRTGVLYDGGEPMFERAITIPLPPESTTEDWVLLLRHEDAVAPEQSEPDLGAAEEAPEQGEPEAVADSSGGGAFAWLMVPILMMRWRRLGTV